MSRNGELLRKADLAIADLQSGGGVLNPEQGNRFIRKLIDQPTILNSARVVEMVSPVRNIDKIGFGKRIMRRGTEGVALDTAAVDGAFNGVTEATARAKPTTSQVVLTTKEVLAEVRITYNTMEDNIERAEAANNEASNTGPGGLRNTIIDMIAERAALDMEELALLGDTDSTDPYLGMFDGYIELAEDNGNVVDADGAAISKATLKAGVKAMPTKYKRNLASLRHYISHNNYTDYQDTYADRPTPVGDQALQRDLALFAYGSQIERAALMPESKGLYTNPLNLLYGIQRDVSLEFDKDITARSYIIVLTARVAVQVEESEALVVYNSIG